MTFHSDALAHEGATRRQSPGDADAVVRQARGGILIKA
jgi:hypothetical protein